MKMENFVIICLLVQTVLVFRISAIPVKRASENVDQDISFEDKSFRKYEEDLLKRYNYKNYFAAIYQNDHARNEFAKFLNAGLTKQVRDDLAGLRVYRKVGDAEVPVVVFSSPMDSWLGILPQWKRTKRYIFSKFHEFLSLHPELLRDQTNTIKP